MKILIITKHLLDLRDAQSQQSLALISVLSEISSSVDIICGKTNDDDFVLIKNSLESKCILHALDADWIIEGNSLKNKIHRKLQRNMLAILQSKWVKSASQIANDLNAKNDYSLILTIGLPIESNMVGLNLYCKAKWVSAFSDPWPESIMPTPYSDYSLRVIDFFQKKIVKEIIAQSQIVVFTCKQSADLFVENYNSSSDKFAIVPHVAPKKINSIIRCDDSINIIHAGSLSRERFFPELFIAISELPRDSKLKFHFVGSVYNDAVELIRKLKIGNRVNLVGQLKKEMVLDLIRRSNVLMCVEAKMDFYPFLPSKIADYSAFGLPIFAITGHNSATAHIIKNNNAGYVCGYNKSEILESFRLLEQQFPQALSFSLYKIFDRENIKHKYFEILKRFTAS